MVQARNLCRECLSRTHLFSLHIALLTLYEFLNYFGLKPFDILWSHLARKHRI